ncbi:hypothetical protein GCM10027436_03750 [Actinophytocola sediminis]
MTNSFRRRVERVGMFTMAGVAIAAVVTDQFGWLDRILPPDSLPKITLLVLCGITLFLLLELDRFHQIDSISGNLAEIAAARNNTYAGLQEVHTRLDHTDFERRVRAADRVILLNTWIPYLVRLEDALEGVVRRGGEVRVLLVAPESHVAKLRDQALRDGGVDRVGFDVHAEVDRCVQILSLIYRRLPVGCRSGLRLRMFDSIPSMAVYQTDDRYLASMFMHGQLAIDSPQFDIRGNDSELGRQLSREIDTLWQIGREIELG